jgi:hypothetical protein
VILPLSVYGERGRGVAEAGRGSYPQPPLPGPLP